MRQTKGMRQWYYPDMSKAFDSLHPKLLLATLKAYGLSDPALRLMRSYFDDRENRTRVDNYTRAWGAVKRGCPQGEQGSSLGLLLWNVYQNDLFYSSVKSQLSAYADDHQIYCSDLNLNDGEETWRWYKTYFLRGNYSKYQAMAIVGHTQQMEAVIDDCRINYTDTFKLLGVIIDKDLNFSQQISEVCTKTSKMIDVLQRLKNLISTNSKLRIYKTAVLPHLTYCSLVWHFCRASDRNNLEIFNKRGLRIVFRDRVSPYSDLLTHAGMTSLYNMRLQDIAIFMFKIRNRLLPHNMLELFSPSPSNYNLRNSDFDVQRVKTVKYGEHSLRFFGPFWARRTETKTP